MIVFLQLPQADTRLFVEGDTGKLPVPLWPCPDPHSEFVRAFGAITTRGKGGIPGWVGENEVCDANRAMRIPRPRSFFDEDSGRRIGIGYSSRCFYSDGIAVGKYEVFLTTKPSGVVLSPKSLLDFVDYVLHLPVNVPAPYDKPVKTSLGSVARPLAELYLWASTSTEIYPFVSDKEWIVPGRPLAFVECGLEEDIGTPSYAKHVRLLSKYGLDLHHWWFRGEHGNLPVWMLKHTSHKKHHRQLGRTLRLYLMRLHAEYQCLKLILKRVDGGDITLTERSIELDYFQHYLNEVTRRISRTTRKARQYWSHSDNERLAYDVVDSISPGQRDSVLQRLRLARIRPQILQKFERFVNGIVVEEQIMGDKYVVDQAGAVGPNAYAHNIAFTRTQSHQEGSTDLAQLAQELCELHQAMETTAAEAQQAVAVQEVANAEQAARSGNASKVVDHLRAAGNWALEVAREVGIPLAVEVLKQSLDGG